MLMNLDQKDVLSIIISFIFYFVIGFFGAFMKDLYDTITRKDRRIRLDKILIGSIWTAFLFIFLESTWFSKLTINAVLFLAFLNGMLGFEFFGRMTTIAGFQKTLALLLKIKRSIKFDFSELTEGTENEDKKKKPSDKKEKK